MKQINGWINTSILEKELEKFKSNNNLRLTLFNTRLAARARKWSSSDVEISRGKICKISLTLDNRNYIK